MVLHRVLLNDHLHEPKAHTHVEAEITDLDHTDPDAIHYNVANEISAVAAVAASLSPIDLFIAEADGLGGQKMKVLWSTIVSEMGGDLGGPFLPLSAGVGFPLTDDLHLEADLHLDANQKIYGANGHIMAWYQSLDDSMNFGTNGDIVRLKGSAVRPVYEQVPGVDKEIALLSDLTSLGTYVEIAGDTMLGDLILSNANLMIDPGIANGIRVDLSPGYGNLAHYNGDWGGVWRPTFGSGGLKLNLQGSEARPRYGSSPAVEGVQLALLSDVTGPGGPAVLRDGTTTLTANWDAGAFDIRADEFQANVGFYLWDGVTKVTVAEIGASLHLGDAGEDVVIDGNTVSTDVLTLEQFLHPSGSGGVVECGSSLQIFGDLKTDFIDEETGSHGTIFRNAVGIQSGAFQLDGGVDMIVANGFELNTGGAIVMTFDWLRLDMAVPLWVNEHIHTNDLNSYGDHDLDLKRDDDLVASLQSDRLAVAKPLWVEDHVHTNDLNSYGDHDLDLKRDDQLIASLQSDKFRVEEDLDVADAKTIYTRRIESNDDLDFIGSPDRPFYNSNEVALLSDVEASGGGFFPIFAGSSVAQQSLASGPITVEWDESQGRRVDSGYTHSTTVNPDEITLEETGWYLIMYDIGIEDNSTDGETTYGLFLEFWDGASWTHTANDGGYEAENRGYTTGTSVSNKQDDVIRGHTFWHQNEGANTKIRIRVTRGTTASSPNMVTDDECCRIYIEKKSDA